tara:strand:- start:91 stop:318 length:228 start_codon:yes stop_codon:yes gene_type:complete
MRILNKDWSNEEEDDDDEEVRTYAAIVMALDDDNLITEGLSSHIGQFLLRNLKDLKDQHGEKIAVEQISISINRL